MKTSRKIIIAILIVAIICGAVLGKLGNERNRLLGVWKVSVNGESVLKNIIDFNAFSDARLREEMDEKFSNIFIPVRVQFNADNSYQISVDRRDADAVTEQYVAAIRDYLVEYAKKNISEFVDKNVSEATGNIVDTVKSYLGNEIQEKTDSMISGVMERILTDDDDSIANKLLNLLNKYLGLNLRNQADTVITGLLENLLSENIDRAADKLMELLKGFLGEDFQNKADSLISSVVERMLTQDIDRSAVTDRIQSAFDASGSYRVAFGRIIFSTSRWEDIELDNIIRYNFTDSKLMLNRSGKNEGSFTALLGLPLEAA